MYHKTLQLISAFFFLLLTGILGYYTAIKTKNETLAILNKIHIRFQNVDGIKFGNPVLVQGFPLGDVAKVNIDGDTVIVYVALREQVQFYRNYSVVLKNFSVFGKKAIYIDPGQPKFGPVPPEAELVGISIANPFNLSASILQENRQAIKKLFETSRELTAKVLSSDASLSKFLNDPAAYNKSIKILQEGQALIGDLRRAYYNLRDEIYTDILTNEIHTLY